MNFTVNDKQIEIFPAYCDIDKAVAPMHIQIRLCLKADQELTESELEIIKGIILYRLSK